jgi:hypothetical protein
LASLISFLKEEEFVWEDFNSPKGIQRIFDNFVVWLRQESTNTNQFPYSEVSLYKSAVSSLI